MKRIKDLQAGDQFKWGNDTYLILEDAGILGIVSIDKLTGAFVLWLEDRPQGEVLREEFKNMEVEVIN